ncbi:MAG: GAF domain-containing protein [Flavobacteriaceae bacterium]|nr:GAF domain-containing protein [Flavobacteriaceae bacterium]NNL79070.1 GAF domain-containing protein [Flavobacteriaceae bacterium]
MNINDLIESPLYLKISFNKILEKYEEMARSKDEFTAARARRVLEAQKPFPELREGFEDPANLEDYKEPISVILEDSFSDVLSNNEIKTASVPFHNVIFNSSERFKNIIKTAGDDFELQIKNMPKDDVYIMACTIIIKFCYGLDLSFKRPFFYQIPDANGIMRHYKILYNADFTEIEPTDKAKKITQEDVDELLDHYDNIDLWKEKFPPNSYIFKGFVISNIFDVTDDQSISNIKSNLINDKRGTGDGDENFMHEFQEIFRSYLNIKDLEVGFSVFNKEDKMFERVYGEPVVSFLLNKKDSEKCDKALCNWSMKTLLKEKKFYSVSDVDKYYELSNGKAPQYKSLKEQGYKSAVLAPIANDEGLLGILELVSKKPKVLNSVNANRLIDIMPFMVSAVERSKNEEENLIEAVIQQECTSIHPSVHWKFRKEARAFIQDKLEGRDPVFNKIAFEDIYPLYGQIDIKGSSMARNKATQQDLSLQLNAARTILEKAFEQDSLPIYEQIIYQTDLFLDRLQDNFQVDSEQRITQFFRQEISPLFYHLLSVGKYTDEITSYFNEIDEKLDVLYKHRKDYDDTISLINRKMSELLDDKQIEAQEMYPHFYERYKTDGVEHNLYIGESITKDENFNKIFLYNLRLWQLQAMIEMENAYYQMQPNFPVNLDVASMILVFNQPLSISFRMDEKHFDVDGTYNARYEIVKKRVDKAYIKGTTKRITEKGKISIVYSQKQDEVEYLRYVNFLQSKNYLDQDVEIVELEDLQAVTGLKAIRVSVLYHKDDKDQEVFTYEDLMKELNA